MNINETYCSSYSKNNHHFKFKIIKYMGCHGSKDLKDLKHSKDLKHKPLIVDIYCHTCAEKSIHTLNIQGITLESDTMRPSIPVCGMCNNCSMIHCMTLSWIKTDAIYKCIVMVKNDFAEE